MSDLNYQLERTIQIDASPETVFRFFTDSTRWARWWGAGSSIEAQRGGRVRILHPGGVETLGEVLEIAPPAHLVFSYGFASGKPIPPGGSRVTIRLAHHAGGTQLSLLHEFPDSATRDEHIQGWRFQLALFGNVIADEVFAGAAGIIDAWFDAWTVPDAPARDQAFARIAAPDIEFRDRYSLLLGIADVSAHAAAAQRFMPGVRMRRKGEIRHCQGTVLADWIATGNDGHERFSGTNVFHLDADCRIRSATGFANRPNTP